MQPLISIIVPIYNVELYLERCVQSILNQTYTNIEIILVDDGSPDKCGKICDELAQKDARIVVIHKPNGGLSDARNAGLDLAKGELIGFIDSDDYIHPEMYSILYKNMIDNDADLSMCDYKAVESPGAEIFDFDNNTTTYNNIEALEMLFTYYCQVFVIAWNKLYRKEVFKELRYTKGKIHEDELLTYKILHQANKIVYSDARLYYYFQSPNSIIHSQFSEKKLHYADAMEERLDYFNQHQLTTFYNQTLQKYCVWLLYFYYLNRSAMSDSIRGIVVDKISLYCNILIDRKITTVASSLVYRISIYCPLVMGALAYQSIFGLNFVSRFSRRLFSAAK